MKGITQNEFLQGVAFTHKFYEQKYKYGQADEYGTYLVKQGGLMETSTIHTITERGFVVSELIFDVSIDVEVLFADCFAVENQPQPTNQPAIDTITKDEFLQNLTFTCVKKIDSNECTYIATYVFESPKDLETVRKMVQKHKEQQVNQVLTTN